MKLPHLIHRWEVVDRDPWHRYQRCRVCGKREIRHDHPAEGIDMAFHGHDWTWLHTGEWERWDNPPWRMKAPTE